MSDTVFAHLRFWMLVIFSVVLPVCIYVVLLLKQAISRPTILAFGFALLAIAGVDLYLLQSLVVEAKLTPSLSDDVVFVSEITFALYLLPLTFGGIGVNIVSHFLVRHLDEAEKRFEKDRSES